MLAEPEIQRGSDDKQAADEKRDSEKHDEGTSADEDRSLS